MEKILMVIITLLMCSQAFAGGIRCVATQANDRSVKKGFLIDYVPPASKIIFDESMVEETEAVGLTINFSSRSIIKNELILAASVVTPKGYVLGVDFRFNSVGEFLKSGRMKVGLRDIFGLISQSEAYIVNCK